MNLYSEVSWYLRLIPSMSEVDYVAANLNGVYTEFNYRYLKPRFDRHKLAII